MNACADVSTDEELSEALERIIDPYRGQPTGLIQVLAEAQKHIGYLPRWVQARIAEGLGLSLQEVYGVVTFYAYFSLIPKGRHKVCVCTGTACYVKGSNSLLKSIRETIGIKPGQTTSDSRYSLQTVRCIGACGLAPAMIANDKDVHGRLAPNHIPEILERYE
jgi:NADH-quinone oxidoreductase subunit E